jgi:hypothetical protein
MAPPESFEHKFTLTPGTSIALVASASTAARISPAAFCNWRIV